MFSSIASFLPSALKDLHISSQDLPRPTINPEEAATEDEDEKEVTENNKPSEDPNLTDRELPKSRKEREKEKEKEKLANETFIFVRPPPSKTNHPLNLQVQLVPPNAKPPSGVVPRSSSYNNGTPISDGASEFGESETPISAGSMNSMSSQGHGNGTLQRSSSTKSRDRHSTSANNPPEPNARPGGTHSRTNSGGTTHSEGTSNATASTASFASFASASSVNSSSSSGTSSGRRTIIPLYNLQAHNVLTNVIVDAGNDAKIAKFQKRGIEVIDVALMEPVEVWGEKEHGLGGGGGTSSYTIQGNGNGGSGMKEAQRESARLSVDELGAMMGNFSILGAKDASTKEKSGSGLLSARSIGGFFQSGSQQSSSRPPTPSAASSATSLHSTSNSNSNHVPASTAQHRLSNSFTPDSSVFVASPPGSPRQALNHPYRQQESPAPAPPPKRNLFNKLFNKRTSTPPPPPSVILVEPATPTPDPNSTPTPDRIISPGRGVMSQQQSAAAKDKKGNKSRAMPPPLTGLGSLPGQETVTRLANRAGKQLLSPPDSAATTRPGSLSPIAGSEQVTPTATPRLVAPVEEVGLSSTNEEGPTTPTSAVAPSLPEKKGHGRNLSLTAAITSPLKATLNKNKSRISAVVSNVVSGSPNTSAPVVEESSRNGGPHGEVAAKDFAPVPSVEREQQQDSRDNRSPLKKPSMSERMMAQATRDVSPNPSVARSAKSRRSLIGMQNGGESGNGSTPQVQLHPAQQQQQQLLPPSMIQDSSAAALHNARQQQLQLRPPVLGIQPTFVSASSPVSNGAASGSGLLSSAYSSNNATTSSMGLASPLVSARGRGGGTEDPASVLQGQRALMYVWLVRRWLKRRQSIGNGGNSGGSLPADAAGFFSSLSLTKTTSKSKDKGKEREMSASHAGHVHAPTHGIHGASEGTGGPPSLPYGGVEVRFEWKRAKVKDKGKSRKGGRRSRNVTNQRSRGGGSDNEMERSASIRERERLKVGEDIKDAKERIKAEEKKRHRMSTGSISTTTQGSDDADGSGGGGFRLRRKETSTAIEDDDESDPEDSETPWVCTLKVRRSVIQTSATTGVSSITNSMLLPLGAAPPGGSGVNPSVVQLHPQILRVKVGTLSPTPHHPKVVAMLKVPYPLPDIEVERMGVVKRKGFPDTQQDGGEEEGQEPYDGLTLTAEEIKDIVCSTGLWLVVREGFGGVGRVSRKGDGWRIRA
ncbi:hypothetical protein BJ165DRAFT_1522804 [Panaeolus papilionaceus]|nr:hypothetical protein BJ165DRAFT_1522804 [Panaeolus papilionaceus]